MPTEFYWVLVCYNWIRLNRNESYVFRWAVTEFYRVLTKVSAVVPSFTGFNMAEILKKEKKEKEILSPIKKQTKEQ